MHAYDAPRRQVPPPIPSARAAHDSQNGPSATPIYDRLYAEYVKTFRSLPGDRSGEEALGFTAFGSSPHGSGSYGSGSYDSQNPSSYSSSYSAYSAGANSARTGTGQQPQWQRIGLLGQHGTMTHVPAALPPGTRGQ
ncbi:hypothetical protein [Streptomyces sp. NPDC093094]|uniref:hypothetical protein n=1 Tax=Streptomyces sp. NPDC093094 TaxID=3366026 RepID=UPI0037FF974B